MKLFSPKSLLLLLFLNAPAAIADDISEPVTNPLQGFVLGAVCLNCHQPGAAHADAIPSLQGVNAAAIATSLREFRSGQREATVMNRLARGYSDEEIEHIADWLATRMGAQ